MRRLVSVSLAALAVLTLAACGEEDQPENPPIPPTPIPEASAEPAAAPPAAEPAPPVEPLPSPAVEAVPPADQPEEAAPLPPAPVPRLPAAGPAEPADDPAAAASPAEPPVEAAAAAPADPLSAVVEANQLDQYYWAVLVDPSLIADPDDLEIIGRHYCDMLESACRTAIWYERRDYPIAMPVSGEQISYQAFAFGRTLDGRENMGWNCDVFPEYEAAGDCLPRRL